MLRVFARHVHVLFTFRCKPGLTCELGIKRVYLAWVSHFLKVNKIQARFHTCTENLMMITNELQLLTRVITTNESWIHHYDPLQKNESSAWLHQGDSWPKKVWQWKSAGKVFLIAFFICKGMIYLHHYPPSTRVNKNITCWSLINFASTLEENIRNWPLLDTPSRRCMSVT